MILDYFYGQAGELFSFYSGRAYPLPHPAEASVHCLPDKGDLTGQPLRSSLMDLPEPAWTQKSRPGTEEVSDGQAV